MEYFDSNNIKYDVYTDDLNKRLNLEKYDLIIKTPGIKPNTLLLKEAKSLNISVITDLELYYFLSQPTPIIGVTGSNGKQLLSHY